MNTDKKRYLLIFLLTLLTGCGGYGGDRLRDWMDIGTLTLDVGSGFGAHVQVTDVFRLGYEDKTVWRFGASGRMAGYWQENRQTWSVGPLGEQALDVREVYCIGVDHWDALTNHGNYPSMARVFTRQRYVVSGGGTGVRYRDRTPMDIGYSLNLGFAGVSHDFRVIEVVDFIFGFFGYDLGGDDWPRPGDDPYR